MPPIRIIHCPRIQILPRGILKDLHPLDLRNTCRWLRRRYRLEMRMGAARLSVLTECLRRRPWHGAIVRAGPG